MKLPKIVLAGFQKCGTTTLHKLITKNLNICAGDIKEPSFFAYKNEFQKGIGHYFKNYQNCPNNKYLIDCSTNFFFPKSLERTINTLGSDLKIIIIIRNPIDRIESAFNHFTNKQNFKSDEKKRKLDDIFPINFQNLSLDEVIRMEKLEVEKYIKLGQIIPTGSKFINEEEYINNYKYIYNSIYSIHINRLKKLVNSSNILFLSFDELINNQYNSLLKVANFLNLEIIKFVKVHRKNEKLKYKNIFLKKFFTWKLLRKIFKNIISNSLKIKLNLYIEKNFMKNPKMKFSYGMRRNLNKLFSKELKKIEKLTAIKL